MKNKAVKSYHFYACSTDLCGYYKPRLGACSTLRFKGAGVVSREVRANRLILRKYCGVLTADQRHSFLSALAASRPKIYRLKKSVAHTHFMDVRMRIGVFSSLERESACYRRTR